ncbi:MAG: GNAT family N-acetyltransferase [Phocaeicola sp.]|uniref:GNAT family N-acetyltransferase n=1 Tax=Phocaeicola sp. TaxID=2773926 RepID=UPI0023CADE7A|nr:GNAT family N-acetyltransferase [Phocaeicola sp.]MDE5677730.1 GNAT family N-acetyltransferase [Phocaeicola sp.]MDE6179818.1 GNAT family N-acetyltransferase [Phocaeicola sp.]
MIRRVELRDVRAITYIYNVYVEHSVATFETEPLKEEEMCSRIAGIASRFPYFVYEDGEEGKVAGYCYAHLWKEKAAYRHTLETTIYLAPGYERRGIGRALMERLIEECRKEGYRALIACVTEGNTASEALHLRLGFAKVSHFEGVGMKFGRWLDVVDYELLLL